MANIPYTRPFTIAPALAPYSISRTTYLEQRPGISQLAVGVFVFHNDSLTSETRLLLVQRAAHESFANCWETPGGGCEDADVDETILHGLARELDEETGLTIRGVVRRVPYVHQWVHRKKGTRYAKENFEVTVETTRDGVHEDGVVMSEKEIRGEGGDERIVRVVLDAKEHQRYKWVTKEEVQMSEVEGEKLEWMDEQYQKILLVAFEEREKGLAMEREKSLVVREMALAGREHALVVREKHLVKKEEDLAKREEHLAKREEHLAKRESLQNPPQ